MNIVHVANVSGGKDSDVVAKLAQERQARARKPMVLRFLFSDTGHEHAWTYEHIDRLEEYLGEPIERIRQDFSEPLARRRARLPEQWSAVGVPQPLIDRALEILHPTGIPYLDLVLSKGMFAASVSKKFCTELLKVKPAHEQVIDPLLAGGISVVQWLGIRAEESEGRADVEKHPPRERIPQSTGASLVLVRPILPWKVEEIFAFHGFHGMPINPLYAEGFSRVGCFPCINERKDGLAIIARRFPEAFEKLAAWEALCTEVRVTRRLGSEERVGFSTFFAGGKVPNMHVNRVDDVARWAITKRGGKQQDMFAGSLTDDGSYACTGGRGWCEA